MNSEKFLGLRIRENFTLWIMTINYYDKLVNVTYKNFNFIIVIN